MASRPRRSSLGVLLALGAWLWPLAPEAALFTAPLVKFEKASAEVTDSDVDPGTTSISYVKLGSSDIEKFDPSLGVLTGATLNLGDADQKATRLTLRVSVESTAGGVGNLGDNERVTSHGQGSGAGLLTAPGVYANVASLSLSDTCKGNPRAACNGRGSEAKASASGSFSVADTSLDTYVGDGKVTVERAASSLTASQRDNVFAGIESTTSTLEWGKGGLTATYEYLLHAAPSFSKDSELLTLSYNFGTLDLGEGAATWSFDIFNLLGADRVGLDLDSIVGEGDGDFASFFLSGPGSLANLAPGKGSDYEVGFQPSSLGDFSATYFFNLSDADVGAASSRYPYRLMLSLSGSVVSPVGRQIEPRNNVPEPATLALFTLGVAALPLVRRRRTPA